jgi:hypothetical protein
MRLSWQEIRTRARAFSERWHDAHYEKGETQSFYNEFFHVFGMDRKKVAIFEKRVEMIDRNKRGFIDLFWPSVLIVEQKSAGRDLLAAQQQAFDYILGLRELDQPKWVLTCDFQRFRLLNLETRAETNFTLPELHKHVEAFAFIMGVQRRSFGTQAAVNIKAAELMGKLHDALEASGYKGHDLERLLVRLLFCLFADDTGIFAEKDDFLFLIEERTAEDGSDVGRWLNDFFDVLDTPDDDRQNTLDPELARFPYINGALFTERLRTAHFDARMRDDLIAACKFDWGKVSPAIFGSLFQSVMDAAERRKKGAHYTTEINIMKVIGPLFLDDLRAELDRLKARRDGGRRAALLAYQEKLAGLNFLDPACGCGNFLVITYRELRALELEALKEVWQGQQVLDVELLGLVSVEQFFGIEFEEFPAYIAEVAMWMADHLANSEMGMSFGKVFARIPLRQSAHIRHGDALEVDWNAVLPHEKCFAVLGNPPFIGAKFQSAEQRAQVKSVAALGGSGGTLDYVAAWFIKAGAYIAKGPGRIGFVSTNSITQGEQVAQLWPILFDRYGLEIAFTHRTFAWGSDARGKAHVHVVIIGLTHRAFEPKEKRLFSYADISGEPDETRHNGLTAYLFDAGSVANRHLTVALASQAINGARKVLIGLVIPKVSSERREYVPIGWVKPPTIPSDLLFVIEGASLYDFGILTSHMHMAWLRHIGGRLESRYRYSIGLVYNTFPWPDATEAQREKIETLAQAVLDARAEWPTSSLADLYDPDTMPANLRKAHAALDLAVDRLYRREPFATDRDRVEHLFGRYEALVNPLEREGVKQNKRVARKLANAAKQDETGSE